MVWDPKWRPLGTRANFYGSLTRLEMRSTKTHLLAKELKDASVCETQTNGLYHLLAFMKSDFCSCFNPLLRYSNIFASLLGKKRRKSGKNKKRCNRLDDYTSVETNFSCPSTYSGLWGGKIVVGLQESEKKFFLG
jgi:hypothetical protein